MQLLASPPSHVLLPAQSASLQHCWFVRHGGQSGPPQSWSVSLPPNASSSQDAPDGDVDGLADGDCVGLSEGDAEGDNDGDSEGLADGLIDGDVDGSPDGLALGDTLGDALGDIEGEALGEAQRPVIASFVF